ESAAVPSSIADMVDASLRRTLGILTEVARREGIDREDITKDEDVNAIEDDAERQLRDPLAAGARRYGELAWRIAQALEPVVAERGDAAVGDAVDTIEWFSTLISAKIRRAICARPEGAEEHHGVQSDHNGS